MAEMIQAPEPMPREELAAWLERLAASVRSGDSMEGFVEYLLPDPDDPVPGDGRSWRMVTARVRTGNLMGQGGMTMIGRFVERPPVPDARCVTAPDGACTATGPCMHTPPEETDGNR